MTIIGQIHRRRTNLIVLGLLLYCVYYLTIIRGSSNMRIVEFAGAILQTSADAPYTVWCYTTNWSQYRKNGGQFRPKQIDATSCTHVLYGFIDMDCEGNVKYREWNEKELIQELNDLKKINPAMKTLFSVGGWNAGSTCFSSVVNDETGHKKANFVSSVVQFARANDFDGFDIDWEYPPAGEKEKYTDLLERLRDEFMKEAAASGRSRLILTAALASGVENIRTSYDISQISKFLDYMLIMAYDLHGQWDGQTGLHSALQGPTGDTLNQNSVIEFYLEQGAPRSKLVLGVPAYGRSYRLQEASKHGVGAPTTGGGTAGECTAEGGFLSYYEICSRLRNGWTREYSVDHKAPFAYHGDQWVGYDDPQSVTQKVAYIKDMSLAGAMVWDVSMDDFDNQAGTGRNPLIKAITDGLLRNIH